MVTKNFTDATYASLSAANTFTATNNFSTLNSTAIVITDPTTKPATATSGSLTIKHTTSGGSSSIVFPSAVNFGSDYGYIQYDDNRGSGGENAKLTIGTSNDADDDLYLSPSGSTYIPNNVTIGNYSGFTTATEGTIKLQGNNGAGGNYKAWNFKVGATSTATSSYNTHRLRILDETTERLTIDENGRLGIGTAAPSVALDVVGEITSSSNVTAIGDVTIGNFGPGFSAATQGTLQIQGNNGAGGNYRRWVFKVGGNTTATSGYNTHRLRILDNTTERLTIDDSGRLGIGTATPSVALDVVGSANISGDLSVTGTTTLSGISMYRNIQNNVVVGFDNLPTTSTSSYDNFCYGTGVMKFMTTGNNNVGVGNYVLGLATTANESVGIGVQALGQVLTGGQNTAIGFSAAQITTGSRNTCIGQSAGVTLTSGTRNTYIGSESGGGAITTGSYNTAIGDNSGKHNFSNTTCIGYDSIATANNQIVLGTTSEKTISKGGIEILESKDLSLKQNSSGTTSIIQWLNNAGSALALIYASTSSNAFNFDAYSSSLTNGFRFLFGGNEVANISTAGVFTMAQSPRLSYTGQPAFNGNQMGYFIQQGFGNSGSSFDMFNQSNMPVGLYIFTTSTTNYDVNSNTRKDIQISNTSNISVISGSNLEFGGGTNGKIALEATYIFRVNNASNNLTIRCLYQVGPNGQLTGGNSALVRLG